jgi:hypothetical protein
VSEYTGQAQPTLVLVNNYPVMQHIFVDEQEVGTVACGASQSFPLALGRHDVVASDSSNIHDNPVSDVTEAAGGYRYTLEVFVSGSQGHARCRGY